MAFWEHTLCAYAIYLGNSVNQRDVNPNCSGREGPNHEFRESSYRKLFVHYIKSLKNPHGNSNCGSRREDSCVWVQLEFESMNHPRNTHHPTPC